MKKQILILITLITTTILYSQNIDGICNSSQYFGLPLNQIVYTRYVNKVIKKRYTSFKEVTNNTPEELMKSQLSVNNNKWLSFNFGKEMNWNADQFKNATNPNNYLELLCKITTQIDGIEYAILKINTLSKEKEKPQFLSLVLRKLNNRWVINSNKILSNLNFLFMFMSVDDIDSIFLNKKSSNEEINQIIKKSWNNNILDISKIEILLGNIMMDSKYKKTPTEQDKIITNQVIKKIKVIYNYPLENQRFCYYYKNEIGNYNEEELNEILDWLKSKQTEKIEIFPIHKFTFKYKKNNYLILKYYENKTINSILLIKEDNKLLSYKGNNKNIQAIYSFIKLLKTKSIIELTNGEDNPKYSDLKKIKSKTQDYKSVINIKLINDSLKNNNIKQYLDN